MSHLIHGFALSTDCELHLNEVKGYDPANKDYSIELKDLPFMISGQRLVLVHERKK